MCIDRQVCVYIVTQSKIKLSMNYAGNMCAEKYKELDIPDVSFRYLH